jgi:hypothetical protein
MKRHLLLTLPFGPTSLTRARAARDRVARALTAVLGCLVAPRGMNQRPLTLSIGAIAIASLVYCLAPRLRMGGANDIGTIATIAIQASISPHPSPALETYRDALICLARGEDAAACRLLVRGRGQALVITNLSSVGMSGGEMSGAMVMMGLSGRLCDRARAAASQGDRSGALGWLRAARSLGDQALTTDVPTLDALLAARAIDKKTGRTEIAVLRQVGTTAEAARAIRRDVALGHLWAARVTPVIHRAVADHVTAFQQRRPVTAGGRQPRDGIGTWQAVDRRDAARAENLIALYGQERQRVGAGE